MRTCHINQQPIPSDVIAPLTASQLDEGDYRLSQSLESHGYLLIRGLLDAGQVLEARREVFTRLAEVDEIESPAIDGIATGRSRRRELHPDPGAFWRSVSEGPLLREVTHGAAMQTFMNRVFREPVRGYDYIFLRPGVVGRFTFLHYDFPFFARGTRRVVTAWMPLGSIAPDEGGLFILEMSHRFDDLVTAAQAIDYAGTYSPQVQMTGDPVEFARQRGSRLLTTEFEPGDVILFGMTTMHGTFDNDSPEGRTRLSVDVRWQPAAEPIDGRYVGSPPAGTTGAGYGELNGARPLTEPWHTR